MGEKSKIAWTDATKNFWMSCTKVSPGCQFCLDPKTRIMLVDGSWKQLREVVVGDQLAGCSELAEGSGEVSSNRLLKPAWVEAIWETYSDTITIDLESGRSITCSPNHRFLTKSIPSGRTRWLEAERLNLFTSILSFGDPDTSMPLSDQYLLGYLAGATAGDGTMRIDGSGRLDTKQSYWRIAVLEDDKPVLDRVQHALEILGIDSEIKPFAGTSAANRSKYRNTIKIEHRSMATLIKIEACLAEQDGNEWMAGWLGGFMDTDGSASGSIRSTGHAIHRWTQKKDRNDYLQRTEKYLNRLGINCQFEGTYLQKCDAVRLVVDTTEERFRAIGIIRPALFRKGVAKCYGAHLGNKLDRVVGIRRGTKQMLLDITTSTRTFIAEGLVTHNCYAEDMMDKRYGKVQWGPTGTRVRTAPASWREPLKWDKQAKATGKRMKVFVASLSDFFEERDELAPWRAEALTIIDKCPNLTWLLLTKRPQYVNVMLEAATSLTAYRWLNTHPNVWIGTSIENQEWADKRIPHILAIPTPNRFLSVEPLLGPVTLAQAYTGTQKVAWTIVGGESGSKARPMPLACAINVLTEARRYGVAPFFKQTGTWLAKELGLQHKKGEDMAEWMPALQIQEFPAW